MGSNAYPMDAEDLAELGQFNVPQQPDLLVKLDEFNPADMTFQSGYKFVLATQHKYMHRVMVLDDGHKALASIMKADKLAIIYDADNGYQTADLLLYVENF